MNAEFTKFLTINAKLALYVYKENMKDQQFTKYDELVSSLQSMLHWPIIIFKRCISLIHKASRSVHLTLLPLTQTTLWILENYLAKAKLTEKHGRRMGVFLYVTRVFFWGTVKHLLRWERCLGELASIFTCTREPHSCKFAQWYKHSRQITQNN